MEISVLELELKKYQDQLQTLTNQLNQLEGQKTQVIANANAVSGAIQAIKVLIDKGNAMGATEVAPATEQS